MKKLLSLTITILCFISLSQAQLYMDSNGRVGIDESSPVSTLSIGGAGSTTHSVSVYGTNGQYYRALQGTQTTTSSNSNYGLVGSIPGGSGGFKLYAVYGSAYRGSTPTSARSYGVVGYAGNGIAGHNYGIYGWLAGSRDGAAVYGTLGGDTYHVDGQYAGFFEGDVHIEGDLTVDGSYPSSDIKLKKDVRVIKEDVISKLESLQVIRFKKKHYSEYKELSDTTNQSKIAAEIESERYTKDRIGLIAQELQLTFPEVVKEANSGYLRVDYTQLIPILVKAITDQQVQIEALQTAIESSGSLKGATVATSSTDPQLSEAESSTLHQNAPNPFTDKTTITYSLSETVGAATLFIYDMTGKQLRNYDIGQKGSGEIIISGGELDPGMYLYSLIADGQLKYSPSLDNDSLKLSLFSFPASWPEKKYQAA